MEQINKTIGYHSTPTDFDPNDSWEVKVDKCKRHNHSIWNKYNNEISNGKKNIQELFIRLMGATNEPMQPNEYDKLERQLNQTKSIYTILQNEDVNKGCIIDDVPNTDIEAIYNKRQAFCAQITKDIDQYQATLEGLRKRDAERAVSRINPDMTAKEIALIEFEKIREKIHYKPSETINAIAEHCAAFFADDNYRAKQSFNIYKAKNDISTIMKVIHVLTGRAANVLLARDTAYFAFMKSLFDCYKNDTEKQIYAALKR